MANGTTSVNLNETTGLPKLDRVCRYLHDPLFMLVINLTGHISGRETRDTSVILADE